MNDSKPSCANCKYLSRSETIRFDGKIEEVRVLCMKGEWERGSVLLFTIEDHPGTFQKRASACKGYFRIMR